MARLGTKNKIKEKQAQRQTKRDSARHIDSVREVETACVQVRHQTVPYEKQADKIGVAVAVQDGRQKSEELKLLPIMPFSSL